MKSATRKGSDIRIVEGILRPLMPDEIRIKVDACGVCGTDLDYDPDQTLVEGGFGHEMAGRVAELGSHVTKFKLGQKVVIESASSCGRCENCRNTRQELCTDIQSFFNLGYFGFAEYTIVPAISAIACEELDAEIASISEPLGVAIDVVRLAEININSNVLILGQGAIGLMALSLVKKAGARRVFVSDFKERNARVLLAQRWGADAFIDPIEQPIHQYEFGCKIDRIIVTSPPSTLSHAFNIAAKGAIISFIGIAYSKGAFCTFNANEFHFKKLQLRASFASPAMYTPLALQYLREGVIEGQKLITHRFPLEQVGEAIRVAKSDPSAIKVMVVGAKPIQSEMISSDVTKKKVLIVG